MNRFVDDIKSRMGLSTTNIKPMARAKQQIYSSLSPLPRNWLPEISFHSASTPAIFQPALPSRSPSRSLEHSVRWFFSPPLYKRSAENISLFARMAKSSVTHYRSHPCTEIYARLGRRARQPQPGSETGLENSRRGSRYDRRRSV